MPSLSDAQRARLLDAVERVVVETDYGPMVIEGTDRRGWPEILDSLEQRHAALIADLEAGRIDPDLSPAERAGEARRLRSLTRANMEAALVKMEEHDRIDRWMAFGRLGGQWTTNAMQYLGLRAKHVEWASPLWQSARLVFERVLRALPVARREGEDTGPPKSNFFRLGTSARVRYLRKAAWDEARRLHQKERLDDEYDPFNHDRRKELQVQPEREREGANPFFGPERRDVWDAPPEQVTRALVEREAHEEQAYLRQEDLALVERYSAEEADSVELELLEALQRKRPKEALEEIGRGEDWSLYQSLQRKLERRRAAGS